MSKTKPRIRAEEFVRLWNEAVEHRETIGWIANKIGCSDQYVHQLAATLRKEGVKLPNIRRTFVETVNVQTLNRLIAEKFGGSNT
jgi:predicted 3-demethylubiquinone-9 3-methyltransferase (glyoxalase superfamily)